MHNVGGFLDPIHGAVKQLIGADYLKPRTIDSDYWQTGADLITSNSGIIHESLANQTARYVAPSPRPRETASAQPAASSPRDCRKYFPSIGAVVAVPCS